MIQAEEERKKAEIQGEILEQKPKIDLLEDEDNQNAIEIDKDHYTLDEEKKKVLLKMYLSFQN